jgi:predicted NBD/HSP70 family sugar kinase
MADAKRVLPNFTSNLSPKPSLLRRLNERAIFELLLRSGTASRTDLIRSLGVTAPTVHKAVASLVEAGLVEEVGFDTTKNLGRPGMVYRVASKSVQVIGVALDVRQTAIVSAGLDGVIDESSAQRFHTPRTYAKLVDAIVARVKTFVDRDIQTIGIGVSTPGELDVTNQRILLSPNLHITDGRSLSADLRERTGIDAIMYHETTGTCLAEWSHGAARGMRNFVMIGVYEGFGTSIVSDGRLLLGRDGMGGELGHVTVDIHGERCGCGNRGCIETVATDQAFARKVSARLGSPMSIETIITGARSGEIDVRRELNEALEYLAIGAAAAINIFNPEAVLLCSRMFDAEPDALARLTERIYDRALKPLRTGCQIIRAEGDTRRGAIASVIHHISGSIGPVF